jgi:hypothetical protein
MTEKRGKLSSAAKAGFEVRRYVGAISPHLLRKRQDGRSMLRGYKGGLSVRLGGSVGWVDLENSSWMYFLVCADRSGKTD